MSFLSIAFLAALPLAAAPLLLHFFDRRRNVVIEWGAMQFLEEAATRRTSARRIARKGIRRRQVRPRVERLEGNAVERSPAQAFERVGAFQLASGD